MNEIEARIAQVSKQLDSNRKSKQADEEAVANMEGKKLEMQNQLDDITIACEELEKDLKEAQEERKWLFDRYSRIVLNGGVVFPKDKASAAKAPGFLGVDSEPLGVARRTQDLPEARTRREQRSASPAHSLKKYSRVHSEKEGEEFTKRERRLLTIKKRGTLHSHFSKYTITLIFENVWWSRR